MSSLKSTGNIRGTILSSDYLIATEEELKKTNDTGAFFYAMCTRFPEANLIFLSNEMNAAVFKGGRYWNWREE